MANHPESSGGQSEQVSLPAPELSKSSRILTVAKLVPSIKRREPKRKLESEAPVWQAFECGILRQQLTPGDHTIKITDLTISPSKHGKICAYANIVFNNCFAVSGIR